jgi:hypothetical protein
MGKYCVILGAGASHDVYGPGSTLLQGDDRWKPPLAKHLFAFNQFPHYWNIIRPYRGARALAQRLETTVSLGEEALEQELSRLAVHPDTETRENFKHVPAYLRDLLRTASREYVTNPSGYSALVHELLAEDPASQVLFLTLNYDDLLEQAITDYDPTFKFSCLPDYIKNRAHVVKLHGSINWFLRLTDEPNITWEGAVRTLALIGNLSEDRRIWVGSDVSSTFNRLEHYWLYPVLTAPLAGKNDKNSFTCPSSHLASATDFLKDCERFLIIGASGRDDDLLSYLDSVLDAQRRLLVHLVGLEQGAQQAAELFSTRIKAFAASKVPLNAYVYDGGFQSYIKSGGLRKFRLA